MHQSDKLRVWSFHQSGFSIFSNTRVVKAVFLCQNTRQMGHLINGYDEGIFPTNTPAHILALCCAGLLLMTTTFLTLTLLFASPMGSRRMTLYMIVMVVFSLFYQVIHIIFLYTNAPPFIDWVFGLCGMTLMAIMGLGSTEILAHFVSTSRFWTEQRIWHLRSFLCVLYLVCAGGAYGRVQYISAESPVLLNMWFSMGITVFAGFTSCMDIYISLSVCHMLYTHFLSKNDKVLQERYTKIKHLAITILLTMICDWSGIGLFAIASTRLLLVFSVLLVNLRALSLWLVFYQLKIIVLLKLQRKDPTPVKVEHLSKTEIIT
ncbi:hypothetical protein EDD86DRAFT_145544 [Gorgonomyces haynaldii]|nr:hypothetical protein EDD86DRAFT_145544 [Gorgonomyces haynaldii]